MDSRLNSRFARIVITILGSVVVLSGCVERQLTINTVPTEALVVLNDEEVGFSPVTVSFNWYGDYNVRISKAGYETLKTHRELKGPWYDAFPFDFFAETIWPGRVVDSYEWTFELTAAEPLERKKLIEDAQSFQKQALSELGGPTK